MPTGPVQRCLAIDHVPLLDTRSPSPPDLILHWNEAAERADAVDVVLHFHGFAKYGGGGPTMKLDRDMRPVSGLDLTRPGSTAPGRAEPTLCMLPRGRYDATDPCKRRFTFPSLAKPDNVDKLIDFALSSFRAPGRGKPARGRLLLTAHSGGGQPVLGLLATRIKDAVDEVHLFDALYSDTQSLKAWVKSRIASRSTTSAMRVLFTKFTVEQSVKLAEYLGTLRSGALDHPTGRYRVEWTGKEHMDIPPTFGWQILRDAGADLSPAPEAAGGHGALFSAVISPAAPKPDTSPLSQQDIAALAKTNFGNAGDIKRFFIGRPGQMDFTDWFNKTLSGQPPFGQSKATAVKMPSSKAARAKFDAFWDSLSLAYDRPTVSALEFATLVCAVLRETSGDFGGKTESSGPNQAGRTDDHGAHPGLAYFFDKIALASGSTKASYNRLGGNLTAGGLFDDADFLAAHGGLGGAVEHAHKGQAFGGAWMSNFYPQPPVSTDETATTTAFIREADFYKFRGRGIIQTTGRRNYLHYVTFIKAYPGKTKALLDLKKKWSDLADQTVLTRSRTADWDAVFTTGEAIARALSLHANPQGAAVRDYRIMSRAATVLNDVPSLTPKDKNPLGQLGSIYAMGRAISGSYDNGAGEYRDRVLALLHAMLPGKENAAAANPAGLTAAEHHFDLFLSVDPGQLGLVGAALAGAQALRQAIPEVLFTSGRRNMQQQASAMAGNVVGNRQWVAKTYKPSPERGALQHWVDQHPAATTAAAIAAGFESVMAGWTDAQKTNLSSHFAGLAFDVQPLAGALGQRVKAAIRKLPKLRCFLDNEGGKVIWHAEFWP